MSDHNMSSSWEEMRDYEREYQRELPRQPRISNKPVSEDQFQEAMDDAAAEAGA